MPEYLTKYLILILGPTGVGKTKLSLQIANCLTQRGYHPYILSADSIQIYKVRLYVDKTIGEKEKSIQPTQLREWTFLARKLLPRKENQ